MSFYIVRIERIRVGAPYESAIEASSAASELSGMTGNEYAVAYDGYPFDRIEEVE